MELTADERLLLWIGIAYLGAAGLWMWLMRKRGDRMLRAVREHIDPALWEELGAPRAMKDLVADGERRWSRFVRSGEYRKRCGDQAIDLIDDYRLRSNVMLVVLLVGAVAIGYRFWPLLKPNFL